MMPEFTYDKVGVGLRIQEKRRTLRLTQENVAERLGKSLRFITEIERGAVGMSIETMLDICTVLKTTPNEILLPHESKPISEMEWLISALSNSSEVVQAVAIDILRAYLRSA